MKRFAEIKDIRIKDLNITNTEALHRIGRKGYLFMERIVKDMPFLFMYEDGLHLHGSKIEYVRFVKDGVEVTTKHNIYIFKFLDKNFYEKYKENEIQLNEIQEYVEDWHNSDTGLDLYEYLGITKNQYDLWVTDNILTVE